MSATQITVTLDEYIVTELRKREKEFDRTFSNTVKRVLVGIDKPILKEDK